MEYFHFLTAMPNRNTSPFGNQELTGEWLENINERGTKNKEDAQKQGILEMTLNLNIKGEEINLKSWRPRRSQADDIFFSYNCFYFLKFWILGNKLFTKFSVWYSVWKLHLWYQDHWIVMVILLTDKSLGTRNSYEISPTGHQLVKTHLVGVKYCTAHYKWLMLHTSPFVVYGANFKVK